MSFHTTHQTVITHTMHSISQQIMTMHRFILRQVQQAEVTEYTVMAHQEHSRQVPLMLIIIGSMSYSKPTQDLLPRPRRRLRFRSPSKPVPQVLHSRSTARLTLQLRHFPGP